MHLIFYRRSVAHRIQWRFDANLLADPTPNIDVSVSAVQKRRQAAGVTEETSSGRRLFSVS
jgi:hypothetical protein